jgi:hypothetical protein
MGTGGWADRGLWEACCFAEARFKAVPPSSSREKPRPVERLDGRSRPLHFSTKIGTPSAGGRLTVKNSYFQNGGFDIYGRYIDGGENTFD